MSMMSTKRGWNDNVILKLCDTIQADWRLSQTQLLVMTASMPPTALGFEACDIVYKDIFLKTLTHF